VVSIDVFLSVQIKRDQFFKGGLICSTIDSRGASARW